jgi:hypothetical protein
MMKSGFMKAGAIGALVTALLATALPAQAQDNDRRGGWTQREQRSERADRPQRSERNNWGGGERRRDRAIRAEAQAQVQSPPGPRLERRGDYGANRDGSYGAYARREWRQDQRAERREDARETRRDFRQGYRAGQVADGRSDRDAYRQGYRQGQREDWRDDRRDVRQAYARGYRAGDRSDDGRWVQRDRGRWDNRGWRNDSRYDWYRYRAANRAIFRPGRYYAPYSNYRYSRIGIGFRLGSPFYSNRYWINDPWHYRLPPAYGPYRWIRYYDDALLVDIYSGHVVDVIHDFFW